MKSKYIYYYSYNYSILLCGLGGKYFNIYISITSGCEFMRVLAMLGVSTDPDSKFILLDDGLVHRFNLMTHFWFE